MKKLAYAIIASTGMVMTCFAPNHIDRIAMCGFAVAYAVATILTNEK